jgi:hypothetical protein
MALCNPEPQRPQQLDLLLESIHCQISYAISLWVVGYPEQARQQSDTAVTRAREVKLPPGGATFAVADVLNLSLDYVLLLRGVFEAASPRIEALIALCIEHGLAFYLPIGRSHQSHMRFRLGEADAAETADSNRHMLAAWGSMGMGIATSEMLAYQTAFVGQLGETEAGLSALCEGLHLVAQTDERYNEAELHRLQGELLRLRGPRDEEEAECSFQRALAVARAQHAKSWELRAATSLARLWQSQGKCQAAYDLLAPLYAWFTEGFDTMDLIDARVLLEAVGGGRHP